MVHDTDYPASQRHAGNSHRYNPGYRKNCGRVGSPAVYGGKRLLPSKESVSKIFESGGTLTIQLYLFMQKAKYNEAFGVAVVLLVIVLGINGLAKYMSHRFNVEAGA